MWKGFLVDKLQYFPIKLKQTAFYMSYKNKLFEASCRNSHPPQLFCIYNPSLNFASIMYSVKRKSVCRCSSNDWTIFFSKHFLNLDTLYYSLFLDTMYVVFHLKYKCIFKFKEGAKLTNNSLFLVANSDISMPFLTLFAHYLSEATFSIWTCYEQYQKHHLHRCFLYILNVSLNLIEEKW